MTVVTCKKCSKADLTSSVHASSSSFFVFSTIAEIEGKVEISLGGKKKKKKFKSNNHNYLLRIINYKCQKLMTIIQNTIGFNRNDALKIPHRFPSLLPEAIKMKYI